MTEQQIIEVEAESLEEARKQIKSQIPEGLGLLSEKVISDGKPKTVKAAADTTEEASKKAHGDIPANASVLEEKEVISPLQKVVTVFGLDEQVARMQAVNPIWGLPIVKTIKLISEGNRGFLGIKLGNKYEAEVIQQAVVEITYKTKAKISAEIGIAKEKKPVATVSREIILEAGSDDELTGMQKLQLIDHLRNIINSGFSEESIQAARMYDPRTKMRKYVEKFLSEAGVTRG